MISLPDSDDVPVDLFLPPLVALLFPLLLVTYKNWLCISSSSKFFFVLFCFFLKRSWRCNFPPNKRGRQRSWPCIFPPKNNLGHTLIYVSQCEMRHSNSVPQRNTGFFRDPFLFFLSLFVTHVSPVCYRSQSLSLTWNFASSSPVFSISFYLPFFALHVCRLIHKLSLCFVVHVVFKIIFFSQTQLAMQFPAKQTRPAAQLAMHFPAEKNLISSTRFEGLISHCLHGGAYARTYVVRSVGRKWRHNQTKISRIDGCTKISLLWGSARARLVARAGAPLIY